MKASDPHYDAKVWPIVHPHGTGSVRSEIGAGAPKNHTCNRITKIQSWFRRTALWVLWKLDWHIKKDLFSMNMRKKTSEEAPDAVAKLFGTAIPKNLVESSAWWKKHSKDLSPSIIIYIYHLSRYPYHVL